MRCEQHQGAGPETSLAPTMEVTLNGLALEVERPTTNWPDTMRQVATAVTSAAMEHALECGRANSATIEVWDDTGRLLVAVSANIQVSWPR